MRIYSLPRILRIREANFCYLDLITLYCFMLQPVSYIRYFRCNNYFLLLVYTSTNLVDPPPMGTIYRKHPLPYLPEILFLTSHPT